MLREGVAVARCTVARLMRRMGLKGVVRGKAVKTTIGDKASPCPLDRAGRQFRAPAPNMLWLSDFTYVSTWQGFAYVAPPVALPPAASQTDRQEAIIIDAFARRIVGWRVSRHARADFVLDAPEQALHERRPVKKSGLIHRSDRGWQYVSIRYTERLAEAGIEPSVGSVGRCCQAYGRTTMADTVCGAGTRAASSGAADARWARCQAG